LSESSSGDLENATRIQVSLSNECNSQQLLNLEEEIMKRSNFISAFLLASSIAGSAFGQPKSVPASNVIQAAKDVTEAVSLIGLQKEFVVDGDTFVDSYFVGAQVIKFKPGARLIFTDKALKMRRNFVVAAKTIEMLDPSKPGFITWGRGTAAGPTVPISGQAPGGAHGPGDGDGGAAGANGATGNRGIVGGDAPNLTLFAVAFKGAPPAIDLRGEDGGKGGTGQRGGDGGVGHQGSPASAGLFDCKSGAGYGGNGGSGGVGGKGGTGGSGGAGGSVTLASLPSAFPTLLTLLRVGVAGGAGGLGGDSGAGVNGGPGGSQGAKALPYCQDEPGRRGSAGANGNFGAQGEPGPVGIQGDVFYTTLSEESFGKLFGI
jgi:hypothetical protein